MTTAGTVRIRQTTLTLDLGFPFAFWMTPVMTLAQLAFAIATTAYILVAVQFEERDLVAEHGAACEHYRRRVPMIIPVGSTSGSTPQSPHTQVRV